MERTAVDWLFTTLDNMLELYPSEWEKVSKAVEQAKEMEKQQIITAMMYAFHQENTLPYGMEYLLKRDRMREDFENYYNETYGTHK